MNSLGEITENGSINPISTLESALLKTNAGINRFREQDVRDNLIKEARELTEKEVKFVADVKEQEQFYIDTLREYRKNILETDNKIYDILDNNIGIPTATENLSSLNQIIEGNVFKALTEADGSHEIVIAKSDSILLPNGKEFPSRKGNVYLINKKSSKVSFIQLDNINEKSAAYVYNEISKFYNSNLIKDDNISFKQFYNGVNSVVHWGYNTYEDEKTGRKRPYVISFKKGTNNSVIEYGKFNGKDGKVSYAIAEITVEEIENKSGGFAEFDTFIRSLKVNLTNNNLNSENKFKNIINSIKVLSNPSNQVQFQSAYIRPSTKPISIVVKKEEAKTTQTQPSTTQTVEEAVKIIEDRFKSGVYDFTEKAPVKLKASPITGILDSFIQYKKVINIDKSNLFNFSR
jgi:hypothetical protein